MNLPLVCASERSLPFTWDLGGELKSTWVQQQYREGGFAMGSYRRRIRFTIVLADDVELTQTVPFPGLFYFMLKCLAVVLDKQKANAQPKETAKLQKNEHQ